MNQNQETPSPVDGHCSAECTADGTLAGEIEALTAIARVLHDKDQATAARILDWAADKYAGCVLFRKAKKPAEVVRGREVDT